MNQEELNKTTEENYQIWKTKFDTEYEAWQQLTTEQKQKIWASDNLATARTLDRKPYVAEIFIKEGETIHPKIIYKIGDPYNGYMPTDDDLTTFKNLLLSQNNDPLAAIIMHYGLRIELEYIPTWLIKLDNLIRKIIVKFRSLIEGVRKWTQT